MEAAPGIEPGNNGFAIHRLTTWLCRLWLHLSPGRTLALKPSGNHRGTSSPVNPSRGSLGPAAGRGPEREASLRPRSDRGAATIRAEGDVAELVDASDLKSEGFGHVGSSPTFPTRA